MGFDPGNHVYARAMRRACPDFLRLTGLSDEEKIGDCIEAVLGLEWTWQQSTSVDGERLRSLSALHDPWPDSHISLAEAARFWGCFSFQTWFIDWIENWSAS